ncbi:hypothetical protein Gotur_023907, partial [Gossypium turneri]
VSQEPCVLVIQVAINTYKYAYLTIQLSSSSGLDRSLISYINLLALDHIGIYTKMRNLHHFLVTAVVIFLVSTHPFEAYGRILNEDDPVQQSDKKGVPAPRKHNGCTYISGGGPPCIDQRGHVMAPPRLQPDQIVLFNAAA